MKFRVNPNCRRPLVVGVGLIVVSLSLGLPNANAQLNIGLPFARKVEWSPDGDYRLRRENGPWLIMCAAFLGAGGEQQAQDLVRELRVEHNLPAYIYHQEFDYSGTIEGKGWQLTPDGVPIPHRMRHLHLDNFVEIAVLVGDFDSLDDKKARKALEKVKSVRPACMRVDEQTVTSHRMGVLREIQRLIHPDEEVRQKGPMRAAFVTTNPMIPDEAFQRSGLDRFIVNMNRDLDFTLLDCRAPYSVRVATFRGDSTFQLDEIAEATSDFNIKRMLGQPVESKLDEAMGNAHDLTVALRDRGWEAYEFHDRFESYVCVGAYDWVSHPRNDGKEEINPAVLEIMERFKARPRNVVDAQGNLHRGALQPLSLPEVPGVLFDVQPLPVQVPDIGQIRR